MTKTLIDIDDAVLARAQQLSGLATKEATVAAALAEMVRRLELDEYTGFVCSGALEDLANPEVIRAAQRESTAP
jgi:Bacterial antitoxin of type II TA system, VapB